MPFQLKTFKLRGEAGGPPLSSDAELGERCALCPRRSVRDRIGGPILGLGCVICQHDPWRDSVAAQRTRFQPIPTAPLLTHPRLNRDHHPAF